MIPRYLPRRRRRCCQCAHLFGSCAEGEVVVSALYTASAEGVSSKQKPSIERALSLLMQRSRKPGDQSEAQVAGAQPSEDWVRKDWCEGCWSSSEGVVALWRINLCSEKPKVACDKELSFLFAALEEGKIGEAYLLALYLERQKVLRVGSLEEGEGHLFEVVATGEGVVIPEVPYEEVSRIDLEALLEELKGGTEFA